MQNYVEAEAKAKYEDEMQHLTTSLKAETCLLLYPWILKDEEGHKRDKKSSPPYINLVEEIFPENFSIEQEFRKSIDENMLIEMFKEVNIFFVVKLFSVFQYFIKHLLLIFKNYLSEYFRFIPLHC